MRSAQPAPAERWPERHDNTWRPRANELSYLPWRVAFALGFGAVVEGLITTDTPAHASVSGAREVQLIRSPRTWWIARTTHAHNIARSLEPGLMLLISVEHRNAFGNAAIFDVDNDG
jgi:hypothetical protein